MSAAWIPQGVMPVRDWSPAPLDTRSTVTFAKVICTLSAAVSINEITSTHCEQVSEGHNARKVNCSKIITSATPWELRTETLTFYKILTSSIHVILCASTHKVPVTLKSFRQLLPRYENVVQHWSCLCWRWNKNINWNPILDVYIL